MKLNCNIDSQGSLIRGIGGSTLLGLAIVLALVAWCTSWSWLWWLIAVCTMGGVAQLFEAANSWCVIRALGYKTKI
ncbi:MAG: hypothetical protein M1472_04250 [Planctomycetes bacterium]|jgi:hypothetical protein|nr:hypothetical protein [Planctomycetota bacterium]